jgi:hypothetical protein
MLEDEKKKNRKEHYIVEKEGRNGLQRERQRKLQTELGVLEMKES